MRRLPRWLVFTAIVAVLALGALSSISVGTVRRSFPELDGRVPVSGLSGSVEVLRDAYGVPQIYADNAEDLFQAQGYVHAQDRFYEMDVRRHITAGRLSELFGAGQVDTDAYIKTMGWRRVAEQELSLLSPSTRRYLDAYAAGVNAYIRGKSASDLSLEYTLLGLQGLDYTPEPWSALDSVSWLKAMAWDLGANLGTETDEALLTSLVGADRAKTLYPGYPFQGFNPIVTGGTVAGSTFDPRAKGGRARPAPSGVSSSELRRATGALTAAARVNTAIPPLIGSRLTGPETGSNSWVVAGSRTASGKAMLSNDPHLATSIPSIFAQVGLHCRTVGAACPFDVSGFSFSGLPGVIIGHNGAIAWGFTTSYLDVQDLYLEEVRGDTVRDGDAYVPLTVREEQIRVAGEDQPRTIRVRSSRHGPLLSDVDAELRQVGTTKPDQQPYAVALSWVALTPRPSMDAVFALDIATDFTQAKAAAATLAAPSQNLVYADTAGNIGYLLPGDAPRRGKGDGRRPSPGWDRSTTGRGSSRSPSTPSSTTRTAGTS